ncbi:hypothetical protein [Arachnia rubra]|jgi:hypothetical protein|uniref:Uncharacterized protein n=1 Tax=Arachnia rubra TaxID=1547448 RepID=A0ABX7Y7F3_9ACTN|nr:hypothetical protein [Arachnia rubra]QUC08453.1 hypothetical protein J5A65_01495 [Arachnia rubra]BCR79834.1 hypothetical protein SK1NUM_02770 [Arachnia rubra]
MNTTDPHPTQADVAISTSPQKITTLWYAGKLNGYLVRTQESGRIQQLLHRLSGRVSTPPRVFYYFVAEKVNDMT